MNKWAILMLMAFISMSCGTNTNQVTETERNEIEQLDSLLNDLAKNKVDKVQLTQEKKTETNK